MLHKTSYKMDDVNRNMHKGLCELNVAFLRLIFLRLTTSVSNIVGHRVYSTHLCTLNAARMAEGGGGALGKSLSSLVPYSCDVVGLV